MSYSAPGQNRVKTFGSMAQRQQSKPRWDASLPFFSFKDFPGKAIEFRFVGAPFAHKLHTIYLDLAHAREQRRWRNRDKQTDKNPANIPRDAKAFDIVCPDFDYIDEKSYPDRTTGMHTCECCGTYSDFMKERLQYFAWCLYKNPDTRQWVPDLKVLRFPKSVAEGIQEAVGTMSGPDGNQIVDIADFDLGGSLFISYNPGAAPANMYRVQRGELFPVVGQMRQFVESNMISFEEVYMANKQDPADISRSLAHWKYPELLRDTVPGASQSFGAPASSAGFGGGFGASAGAMQNLPAGTFDAPPSSLRQAAPPAATIPTFGGDDAVPQFKSPTTIPTFGADDSVPSFGASAGGALPSFMDGTEFAPPPPAGRTGGAMNAGF